MNLSPKPSVKSIRKPQVASDSNTHRPLKIKLTPVTTGEREKYRVPVYDYIL